MNNKAQATDKDARRPNWFEATKPGQGPARWAAVPVQLLLSLRKDPDEGVTTTGLKVFCALAAHCLDPNNPGLVGSLNHGRFRTPGEKRIAAMCGLSVRQVLTGIKNLVQHGWIKERKQRYNNTLVLWLTIPDHLDLVDAHGRFNGLPEAWTECDIDERADEEMAREAGIPFEEYRKIVRTIREPDGSVAMDALMDAVGAYKAALISVPFDSQSEHTSRGEVLEPLESATILVADIVADSEHAGDPKEDCIAEVFGEGISLEDALSDYVRNYDDGGGAIYRNSEIQHFGFTHVTPFIDVYQKFKRNIDEIRTAEQAKSGFAN
ncbi:hypothetical protein [Aquitalea pelogenes]|uniref:hypothetical protein n=1 Tax=Aquitalea pelogenes TaxID=1293573 RepID=UPI0035B11735